MGFLFDFLVSEYGIFLSVSKGEASLKSKLGFIITNVFEFAVEALFAVALLIEFTNGHGNLQSGLNDSLSLPGGVGPTLV